MYSTASISLEGAEYLYASAFPDETDNTFNVSVSAHGHSVTIYSLSPKHIVKLADVLNRAIATNLSTSTMDMEAVSA